MRHACFNISLQKKTSDIHYTAECTDSASLANWLYNQVADGDSLQISRVAADILNKLSQIADKG
jgi:hypothetical protein